MVFKIVILTDKESWINKYMQFFLECLRKQGHNARLVHDINDLCDCDMAFYLSCSAVIPKEILKRNKHNLVVHESALPEGRGWSPLTWKILNGENNIPITLFEAEEQIDSGLIYIQKTMQFNGTELIDELREKQAKYTISICMEFIENYDQVVKNARKQEGSATYYRKRTPVDSQIDINKTLFEQFNLLRVVDNEKYPGFFWLNGKKYILKIYQDNEGMEGL